MLEIPRFLRENGCWLGMHWNGNILSVFLANKCVGTFVGIEKFKIAKIGLATSSYEIGSMAPIPPNKKTPAQAGVFLFGAGVSLVVVGEQLLQHPQRKNGHQDHGTDCCDICYE